MLLWDARVWKKATMARQRITEQAKISGRSASISTVDENDIAKLLPRWHHREAKLAKTFHIEEAKNQANRRLICYRYINSVNPVLGIVLWKLILFWRQCQKNLLTSQVLFGKSCGSCGDAVRHVLQGAHRIAWFGLGLANKTNPLFHLLNEVEKLIPMSSFYQILEEGWQDSSSCVTKYIIMTGNLVKIILKKIS